MNPALFRHYAILLQNELQSLISVLREKGLARFLRPILIGAFCAGACYYLVYLPPARKMAMLKKKIETAKATAQHADAYRELRDRLYSVYAQLPPLKGRDHWLTDMMMETMKADNIFAEQIKPPDESEESGFVFQKVEVTAAVKFQDMVSWLSRLENTKPLLHIQTLHLEKRSEPLGHNAISCGVSTIVPVKRLAQ